jgi:hypothetical protein
MALLVRYIKTHNKFKNISCMFDKEKIFLGKKKSCPHPYFKNALNI